MSANDNDAPNQSSNYAREVIAGNVGNAEPDLNQTYAGSMIEAMDGIEANLSQYAESLESIQKQRHKLLEDYDVGQNELDTIQTEEQEAKTTNREIEHKVALERLGIEHDAERFEQEHSVYAKQSGFWGMAKGALEFAINPVGGGLTALSKVLSGGVKQIFDGRARTKGYETARDVAKTFKEGAIALIEENKIDTDQFPNAVTDITKRLEEISQSEAALKLQGDEVAFERLQKGVLLQRVLASGYEVGSELEEEFLPKYGYKNVNEWLDESQDNLKYLFLDGEDVGGKLHSALTSFVYGGADTNDLHLIIDAANFFQNPDNINSIGILGQHVFNSPCVEALIDYTETVIKPELGYFRSKASIIDVARDASMLVIDDYQSSETALSAQDKAKTRIRSVVMGALADQITGSARVNNYDMRRLFRDRHTRHGNRNLTESELRDGGILFDGPGIARKTVSMLHPEKLLDFDEIVKIKYATRDADLPKLDNPFIRICVHEYFQPQSVNASDIESSFEASPEAPAAYRVINNAVIDFMGKLGISLDQDIRNHQQSVLVQTFFDYFEDIGKRHTEEMSSERSALQNAFGKTTYDHRYSRYQRRLEEALQSSEEQEIFQTLYDENAISYLRAVPASEIEGIYNQLSSNANLPVSNQQSGTLSALVQTVTGDSRTTNMAEPLQLGWMDEIEVEEDPPLDPAGRDQIIDEMMGLEPVDNSEREKIFAEEKEKAAPLKSKAMISFRFSASYAKNDPENPNYSFGNDTRPDMAVRIASTSNPSEEMIVKASDSTSYPSSKEQNYDVTITRKMLDEGEYKLEVGKVYSSGNFHTTSGVGGDLANYSGELVTSFKSGEKAGFHIDHSEKDTAEYHVSPKAIAASTLSAGLIPAFSVLLGAGLGPAYKERSVSHHKSLSMRKFDVN